MSRKTIFCAGLALTASIGGTVAAEQQIRMEATSDVEALRSFQEICVAHFLEKKALFAKLRSDPGKWILHTKRRPSDVYGGVYFESKNGEVGHVSTPKLPRVINDPACHFTFISDNQTNHQSLVKLTIRELSLIGGKDTSSKNAKQVRWDFQNVNGGLVRIFVSSGLKANGREVSRLSISKHRVPPVTSGEETT